MALSDYLVPIQNKTNICIDCQKACGGCSWSEIDPETERPRFEPVPGWTARKVVLNTGFDGRSNRKVFVETYHITACPQFVPDPPRKTDNLELNDGEFLRIRGRVWK